jgi:hypothetical protein
MTMSCSGMPSCPKASSLTSNEGMLGATYNIDGPNNGVLLNSLQAIVDWSIRRPRVQIELTDARFCSRARIDNREGVSRDTGRFDT